jgi:hypothetical protein
MDEELLEQLKRLGYWNFGGDDAGDNDDADNGRDYGSSTLPFAMPAPAGCTVIHHHHHSQIQYCNDGSGDNNNCCWEQPQPRQCDACNKVMGGPHLDMFNSLFRQLAEEMMAMHKNARARANSMMNRNQQENMMPRKFYVVMPRGPSGQAQQQQQKSNKLVIYNEPTNPIVSCEGIKDLAEGQMQDNFECPISLEIMKVPIVMSDGHAYDRESIIDWINQNPTNPTSPLTQKPLDPLIGFYSYNLANSIERWVESVGGRVYRASDADNV